MTPAAAPRRTLDPVTVENTILEQLVVAPGTAASLHRRDPAWLFGPPYDEMAAPELKAKARRRLEQFVDELAEAQELLWASDTNAVLVVFQALDAAGKDSTIKHVMTGINPQGCQIVGFRQPSARERDHTFLWRATVALPERGRIGIFNRSYYEDVLVVRVHPEILDGQQLPAGTPRGEALWQQRYDDINAFERHLDRNGVVVLKFFLHLSKEEQRRRFLARLDNPDKHWKVSPSDLPERGYWDDYMAAFEAALTATSTPEAPWYVIPADHKHVMQTLVAGVLTRTIQDLGLSYPAVGPEKREAIEKARAALVAET